MPTSTRDEQPGDAEAVAQVVRGAFGPQGAQVAALWAELGPLGLLRASLVAVEGDEVVGHVGLSAAWVDARRALVDVMVLSPLSVRPGHQGLGTGTALVAAAVERARRLGAPALFVEGSPPYYGRRGFERAAGHGLLPASVRTPDRAFQVVLLEGHEDWMTGRLVYPDVWWRHDAAGLRDPVLTELEEVLGRSS